VGMERWVYTVPLRLKALFRRKRVDFELDEELRDHLERKTEEYVAKGFAPKEARRRAVLEMGGIEKRKEECRDARRVNWVADFAQDLRIAFRLLRKSPGFAAVAILTLALGIGANTAMFSVVEGVLLAPLPYREPDRLVLILENNQVFSRDAISYPNFLDWQRGARSFDGLSAAMLNEGIDWTAPGEPEHVNGGYVSAGFFATLGAKPALGREFVPQEDERGGAPVAVISNRLWRERFSGDPDALGKSVTLGGAAYTIVGILPANFRFVLDDADVYLPVAQFNPIILDARGSHDSMMAVGRLKYGASIGEARAELNAIQENLDRLYPDANRGTGVDVDPLQEIAVSDVRETLLLLMGGVGLVLLIACANVANLWLARSSARAREFAIRAALGASRLRIVRQLVTESVLLSVIGGALGVLVAMRGIRPLLAAGPGNLPRGENIGVDAAVLWFTLIVSIAVGILFGLAPVFRILRPDVQGTLKEGGRGAAGGHNRAMGGLAVAQVALTLVLLAGAGLLLRTMHELWSLNPGFDTQHEITFRMSLPPSSMKTGASIRSNFLQSVDRIRAIPGVQAADFTMLVPLTNDDNDAPFWIDGQKPDVPQNAPRTLIFDTGPDYLRTMQIPLLQGRFFTADDNASAPCVAVIDTVFARKYFPGKNPLDHRMTFGWPAAPWGPCAIIGVVGHVSHWGMSETSGGTKAQSYYAMLQAADKLWPLAYPNLNVIVRSNLDTAALLSAVKGAVYGTGRAEPIYDVHTMREIVSRSMATQRFPMILLGAFALLALVLAGIGIYGVIAYSMSQRVPEIGIRMALGAERRDVFRMVIGQGARLAVSGLAIGIAAAMAITRVLASFSHLLYGVGASDPETFAIVSLVLAGVVILACVAPAWRAMKVDPMVALRHE
jgi:predicted permease